MSRTDLLHIRDLGWLVFVAEVTLTINAFLDRWFATGLEVGSISSLHYANVLLAFGVTIFTTSLLTVMYPRISEFVASNNTDGCNRYVYASLIRVANLVVPAVLVVAVMAPEIVTLIFQRGSFDAADTSRTSGAVALYVLGLPAILINGIVTRIFHSLQLLKDKIWLAVQYLATNATLNFLLVGSMQVRGLALATTVAINIHMLLSWWLLHRRQSDLATKKFVAIVFRAYAMGIVTFLVYRLIPLGFVSELNLPRLVLLATTIAAHTLVILSIYTAQFVIWYRYWRNRESAWLSV